MMVSEIYHDFLVFFIPFFLEMSFLVLFFDGRFQILHEYSCTFLLNLIFCNDIYFVNRGISKSLYALCKAKHVNTQNKGFLRD